MIVKWRRVSIKEVASFIGRGKSPIYDENSEYYVLNQACVHWRGLQLEKRKSIDEKFFYSLTDVQKIKKGDILINSTGTGTLGRIGYVDKDIPDTSYDSHITLVRIEAECQRFVYYLFSTPDFQNAIENYCITGSTNQIELVRSALQDLVIGLPPLQEQRRVATILTSVDRQIEQTEAIIAKYRQIKVGMMHDLFTRGINPATGQLRPSPQEAPALYRESSLGMIPTEWEVEKIGDFFSTFAGGTPNRSNEKYFGGTIRWVSSGEVNQHRIFDTDEKITELGLKNSSAKKILPNTTLIALYGATAGQVSMLMVEATSNQAVLAVKSDKVDDYFIFYYLKHIKEKVIYLAQGSGQPNLNKGMIDNTLFPLVNRNEQLLIY
jgi:type I restriction enzyme S subunit